MAANPYSAPQARVADVAEDYEYGPIKMWSAKGRIGRLRYLAYSFGAMLILSFVAGFISALVSPEIGAAITLVGYVPVIVFCILIGIQRSHDMNWSGWTILLMIIPLVGFIWMFKGGTKGPNDYGNPPPPNTLGVKILGFIAPAIIIIGILAAVTLPAYQDYTKRVQQLEQQQ